MAGGESGRGARGLTARAVVRGSRRRSLSSHLDDLAAARATLATSPVDGLATRIRRRRRDPSRARAHVAAHHHHQSAEMSRSWSWENAPTGGEGIDLSREERLGFVDVANRRPRPADRGWPRRWPPSTIAPDAPRRRRRRRLAPGCPGRCRGARPAGRRGHRPAGRRGHRPPDLSLASRPWSHHASQVVGALRRQADDAHDRRLKAHRRRSRRPRDDAVQDARAASSAALVETCARSRSSACV